MLSALSSRHPIGTIAFACIVIAVSLTWEVVAQEKPPFYFEFGVDLTYKDKPLRVSRTVECVRPHVDRNTFPAMGRSQEAIAETLDDGSGLIVIVPNLCDAEAWPVSPDYAPLIFWTESANEPTVLEGYLSEAVLRSGEARITLDGVFARPASPENFVGTSRDFVLFGYSSSGGVFREYKTRGKQFKALTARMIGRDQWIKVPEIAAVLPDVRTPGIVPPSLFTPIEEHFPGAYDWDALTPNPVNNDPRNRPYRREALDNAVPFRWVNGAFEPDPHLRGCALVYPVDEVPTLNMAVTEHNNVLAIRPRLASGPNFFTPENLAPRWQLRVGAKTIEVGAGAIYFEPASQQIVITNPISFFLFENKR